MTKTTTTQAIDALIAAALAVKGCRLTKNQKGMIDALLEIALSMPLNDNDMLQGIFMELDEMAGVGNTDELADPDAAINYLIALRYDLLRHLGHAEELPAPGIIEPEAAERTLRV